MLPRTDPDLKRRHKYMLEALHPHLETNASKAARTERMNELSRSGVLAGRLEHLLSEFGNGRHDMTDWACLLDTARERAGDAGVAAVFGEVFRRRLLWTVRGPHARYFWDRVLRWAVRRPDTLATAREYGLWMLWSHGVVWPGLYATAMCHLLERREYDLARRHHVVLRTGLPEPAEGLDDRFPERPGPVPVRGRYAPDTAALVALIKQFVRDPSADMQEILQLVYADQNKHVMYDQVIPFLFSGGQSRLAMSWRKLMLRFRDLPGTHGGTSPSKPFLRFLDAYYRDVDLAEEELVAAGLAGRESPEPLPGAADGGKSLPGLFKHLPGLQERLSGGGGGGNDGEKQDLMCARWFATTVVSVEVAMSALRFLDVREIGPLSLQSIAMRERNAGAICDRIEQLGSLGIGLGASTYSRAVRRLAESGSDDVISDLVDSDIHPDVFGEPHTVSRIMDASVREGDLRRYRTLLAVQLAVADDSTHAILNDVLATLARRGPQHALAVLRDMAATGASVSAGGADWLCKAGTNILSSPRDPRARNTRFIVANARVCRKLAAMNRPVPASHWRRLVTMLGRRGCLDELESLCMSIVDMYRPAGPGRLISVHRYDLPRRRSRSPPRIDDVHVLPTDFPATHRQHLLKFVFTAPLIRAMVRWGFERVIARPQRFDAAAGRRDRPAHFDVARGVRLIRDLAARALHVEHLEEIVRRAVILRLASLRLGRSKPAPSRHGAQLSPDHLRRLFNEAWESDLLPAEPDLEALVLEAATKRCDRERRRALKMSEALSLDSPPMKGAPERWRGPGHARALLYLGKLAAVTRTRGALLDMRSQWDKKGLDDKGRERQWV